jgi:V8-like Glu-specific endopeptidase
LLRAKSIARVCRADGSHSSGFLTKEDIFLTNHHVFHDKNEAQTSIIQFNYQKNPDGLDLQPDNYHLDPLAYFATSKEDDWTLVKVRGKPSEKWGYIALERVVVKEGDFVNIIQHPGGDRKMIALYHNLVVSADDRRIQYLTDTLPGSSGSPVFNSAWQVVALHHSGGWLQEPGVKQTYYRNEGIHINCIIPAVEAIPK